MKVYIMEDVKDGECKYVGIAEDMQAILRSMSKKHLWVQDSKWKIKCVEVKNRDKARVIQRILIDRFGSKYNTEKPLKDMEEYQVDLNEYGLFDPLKQSGGLATRVGTARTNILVLAAMSGGMVSKEVCQSICGSKNYYEQVLWKMKNSKEAETVFGKKPRVLHILKDGCEAIEEIIPGTVERQGSNKMNMREPSRKFDVSTTLYLLQLLGAELYPSRKPVFLEADWLRESIPDGKMYVYAPYEVKREKGESDEDKKRELEIRGSRFTALLIMKDDVYVFYHMGDRNIKFPETRERRALSAIGSMLEKKTVHSVVLGKSSMLDTILENGKLKQTMGKGSHSIEKITPDMNMAFIPTDTYETFAVHMYMLLHPEKLDSFEKMIRTHDKLESVRVFPMYLTSLARLSTEKENVTVLCTKEQVPYINKLCPQAIARPLKEEMIQKIMTGK